MRFLACALVLTAACYEPVFMTGLYCSVDDTCPPGQACYVFSTGEGGRCDYFSDVDGGTLGADAPRLIDGPQQIDAALCSTVDQTGCNSGQKCTVIDASNTIGCQATGSVTAGNVCVGQGVDDNCAAGLVCLFETCHAFCQAGGSPTCGADVCGTFSSFAACMTTCNPLAPACPMSNDNVQNCYVTSAGNECAPSSQNQNLPVGSACTYINDCAAGSGCYGPAGSATCLQYCDYFTYPNQPGTCGAGQTCQVLADPVGVCQ